MEILLDPTSNKLMVDPHGFEDSHKGGHGDYAELLWEGLHHAPEHPSTLIPYPRFTKLIVEHYMTAFPEISRRVRDKYYNLEHDEMVKSIFNSGKNKEGVGMKIPRWMITDEMKLIENYRMYAQVFGVDVSTTQSHPIESTQGTHRTASARRKAVMILKQEKNVEKVNAHLVVEEIEKMVEGTENIKEDVVDNSSLNSQNDPDTRKKFRVLAQYLQEVMEESLPNMVDDRVKEVTKTQVPIYVAEGLILERIKMQVKVDSSVRSYMSNHIFHVHLTQASQAFAHKQQYQLYLTMKDNPQLQHNDLPIWLAFKIKFKGLQASNTPCRPSAVRLRDQDDPHDDAHLEGENSAKRQRCTSGDEHRYHIDQMQNFLKNDILDPKAPALSLVNQDLLYLKKGNSGPEKIVLSLHKFPVVIFPDNDIEERTSRWIDKCVKKFNPYARYSIVHVIKTYGELGHEHKFITEIIASRANGSIMSITEPGYKNLNKNDIKDMYLLCINGKVCDYAKTGLPWSLSIFIRSTMIWERVHDFQLGVESYQQKVNLTTPTITFPDIDKYKMFSIIFEPVYGIIYKNIKKEKRVMRRQEVHKSYDATLKRVLEGLKSYNNDMKHGYVTSSLYKEDAEVLRNLLHIRVWEMLGNSLVDNVIMETAHGGSRAGVIFVVAAQLQINMSAIASFGVEGKDDERESIIANDDDSVDMAEWKDDD
ncbi:retrovirus-related pol polyprotein from transposon TNT 1-94 [Tanacetum coccineum]